MKNAVRLAVIVLLLIATGWVVWLKVETHALQKQVPVAVSQATSTQPNLPTEIVKVELIEQGFWEAKVRVEYTLSPRYQQGYVALHMGGDYNHHTVGLVTTPGHHSGIALISRHYDRPQAYTVKSVYGRMYNPYNNSQNYFENTFPFTLKWPGAEELNGFSALEGSKFNNTWVSIFRNIPDYNQFAKSLVKRGFSPSKITMNLAVCSGCTPSLIFGEGVTAKQIREVLAELKEIDYPIDRIEFDRDKHKDQILIGQSPTQRSKPLWSKVDTLLDDALTEEEFFNTIGFSLGTPRERAVELHKTAKYIIDYESRRKIETQAMPKLITAQSFDPTYMPTYVEMARAFIRADRYFSEYKPSQTGQQASRILQEGIKVDNTHAQLFVLLGYVLAIQEDYLGAENAFARAEELHSDSLWLPLNRGLLLEKQGDIKGWEAHYRQVLNYQNKPEPTDNDRAFKNGAVKLARYYKRLGNLQAAREVWLKYLQLFPQTGFVAGEFATLLLSQGENIEEANRYVDMAEHSKCGCSVKLRTMQSLAVAAEESSEAARAQRILSAKIAGPLMVEAAVELARGNEGRKRLDQLFSSNSLSASELDDIASVFSFITVDDNIITAEYFLKQGSNPDRINMDNGYSGLMLAVLRDQQELVKTMLRYGANPEATGPSGVSAAMLAQQMNNDSMVQLLSRRSL